MLTEEEEERIYADLADTNAQARAAKARADAARLAGDIDAEKDARAEQLAAMTRVIELLQQLGAA